MRLHDILTRFAEIIRTYEVVQYEVAGLHSRLGVIQNHLRSEKPLFGVRQGPDKGLYAGVVDGVSCPGSQT